MTDESLRSLYAPNGKLAVQGDIIKRENLATTLELVSIYGADVFYNGTVTDSMVMTIQNRGGVVSREDFANYRVKWTKPLVGSYRNKTIHTAGAPFGGAVLLEILNIIERGETLGHRPLSSSQIHYIAEAMKHGFASRSKIGDPMNAVQDPVDGSSSDFEKKIISKDYAENIRTKISEVPSIEICPIRFGIQERYWPILRMALHSLGNTPQ